MKVATHTHTPPLTQGTSTSFQSAQIVAPTLLLCGHGNGSLTLTDLGDSSKKPAHVLTTGATPIGAFPVHEGARSELLRWDKSTITTLVKGAKKGDVRLLTYDLRGGTRQPLHERVVVNKRATHAVFDVAGSTAAMAWRSKNNKMQLQLWDLVDGGAMTAQLNGVGEARLEKLQGAPTWHDLMTDRPVHAPAAFRLTDDGRNVLMSNNAVCCALRGSVSVWSRAEAFDTSCTTLRNTCVMRPAVEHRLPCTCCGGVTGEAQPVWAIDIADGLLITAGEECCMRFATFSDFTWCGASGRPMESTDDDEYHTD